MGLKYDRRWMLVTPGGRFISQRTIPQMALIKTSLEKGQLTLSMQGKKDHIVPMPNPRYVHMSVVLWKDKIQAQRVGDSTDAWLSAALRINCHLVHIADDVVRQVDPEFAQMGDRTGFSDGFPMLLVSAASLTDLNRRLDKPVTMMHFRPNIVVSGCEAYAEDQWQIFTAGNITMRGVKLCSRCSVPTIDPGLGKPTGKEPIATLKTFRKHNGKVFFGMNVVHSNNGTLTIGDRVQVGAL